MSIQEQQRSLRAKAKGKIYLSLFKLKNWAQLAMAKRALALQRLCLELLDAEIRVIKQDFPQLGDDEVTDGLIECVSRQITLRDVHPSLISTETLHQKRIDELQTEALRDDDVRFSLKNYFLAAAYTATIWKNTVIENESIARARSVDSTASALNNEGVNRELKRTKERLKIVRAELAERSAIKLDFRLSDLSALAGIISAIFVVSGYLYTHYFFSFFGVDTTLFFSISDYLAASLEQIRYGAFAAVIGLMSMLWAIRDESLKPMQLIRAAEPSRKRERHLVKALMVVATAYSFWTIYEGQPNFSVLHLSGILVSTWLATIVAKSFFKRRLRALAALVALSIFSINVALAGYQRVRDIKLNNPAAQLISVKFKEVLFSGQAHSRVLAINSQYVFLLLENRQSVFIVPRDKVDIVIVGEGKKP